MSHFYGLISNDVNNNKTLRGFKNSGIETYCASWSGAVRCYAYVNDDGVDCVRVEITTWRGIGSHKLLYDGPINPGDN